MKIGAARILAAGTALVAVGMLTSGCRKAGDGNSPGISSGHYKGLSFHYVGDSGEDETINQQLQITSRYEVSVDPYLSFSALDKNHHVLHKVKVSTVFGSDSGKLVVPTGIGYDILRFSGPGEHEVADVRVAIRQVKPADTPGNSFDVTTQALDAQGNKVDKSQRFSQVSLTNEGDLPVTARIVYIVWDQPRDGETQQAVEVVPIGGLIPVTPHDSVVVKVTGAAAAAVARDSNGPAVSIKAFNSY
jgi:hypothetical protein